MKIATAVTPFNSQTMSIGRISSVHDNTVAYRQTDRHTDIDQN